MSKCINNKIFTKEYIEAYHLSPLNKTNIPYNIDIKNVIKQYYLLNLNYYTQYLYL